MEYRILTVRATQFVIAIMQPYKDEYTYTYIRCRCNRSTTGQEAIPCEKIYTSKIYSEVLPMEGGLVFEQIFCLF